MIASASRNLLSMTTILPRSICWTSPDSNSPTFPENSSRMRLRSPSRTRWMMRCFAAWTAVRPNCSNGTSSSNTSPGWKSGSSNRASSSVTWVPGSSTASTTVFSTTMRIDPFISSIPISARTLGPYRFTRAACRPSLSRSISSPRSSCFVLVSSRIAETTSVALAISVLSPQSSVFSFASQTGITDLFEPVRPLRAALRRENHRFLIRHRHDPGTDAAQSSDLHVHVAADELDPMAMPAHGPLDPRARHLQDIPIAQGTTRIEPLFERPADPAAVFDRDVPRRTVNADLDERSVRRTADAQVGQIEPQCFQPGPEGLDKTLSEHEKKERAELRPLLDENVAGVLPMANERSTDVGHHPSIPPARRSVREKAVAILGTAPGGHRDVLYAELARLLGQDRAEIEHDRTGQSEPDRNLRTHFITVTTNTYAAMHYNVAGIGKAAPLQELDALLEDPVGGAAPARVHERDRAFCRDREVHRNTVGDGDGEQDAALGGRMSVGTVEDEPAVRERIVPAHVGAVGLMRQHHGGKAAAERGAERAPAADHLSDRLVTPEPETERPRRDARDDAVSLGPLRQLETGDGGVARRDFGEGWDGRSMQRPCIVRSCPIRAAQFAPPALATGRRCARSPARSARCSGSPNRPAPRARPATSPCRRGCRDSRPAARATPRAPRSRRDADRTKRCAHPYRSACRRKTAATRTAFRTRAAVLRTGSPRRWRWT